MRLVLGDFLEVDLDALLRGVPRPIRVAGNLPYNVASPILFRLLDLADEGRRVRDASVMLQKEVADRLVAAPGREGYGALAIQVQLLADVDRLLALPPGAFRPAPKVASALVRLQFRAAAADVGSREVFARLGAVRRRSRAPASETGGAARWQLILAEAVCAVVIIWQVRALREKMRSRPV